MAKYRVIISGTWNYTAIVEAENETAAKMVACDEFRCDEGNANHDIEDYEVDEE